jgi:hypothetical protein
MLKKLLLFVVALSCISLPANAFWQNDDITMLVVPREEIPLQIAQDISRRYPVLLVSYQVTRGNLKLHAWNGDNWIFVPVEDYVSGTFFANRPKHAIVIKNENVQAPKVLIPSSLWCEDANTINSTDPRTLLHLLGRHFDFPFSHWNQFAKRYNYSIEQINPTLKNVHWWDLRGDILLEKLALRDFTADQDKWYYLAPLPPSDIEPVLLGEKAPVIAPVIPKKIETGATAVDITAKAPEVSIKAPEISVKLPEVQVKKPEAPVIKAPAVKLAPAAKPVAIPEPAPIIESAVTPVLEVKATEPISAIEAVATETPAIAVEKPAEADLFSMDEVPAAEIVVPQEPKKSWWKF